MEHNGYYIFQNGEKNYFYGLSAGVTMSISKQAYQYLKKFQNNIPLSENENRIVEIFRKNHLLDDIEVSSEDNSNVNDTAYLSFAPTYQCNFRCTYCFGEFGNKYHGDVRSFDHKALVKMLDFFFNKAFSSTKHYRIDFVSGGEPLLGIPVIRETVEYIENLEQTHRKNVSIWLCTNASLLTNEIIDFFSKHNISIGISIDGRKEYNDAVRVDAYGNGTYDRICHSISLVHNHSTASKRLKNIWGLCAATNQNCDFIDMLIHMRELGFQNVQIRLIRTKDSYDLEKFCGNYTRLSRFLFEQFSAGDLTYLKMILNDNDQFGKVLKRMIRYQIMTRRCYAGKNKITICPDGSIYPCDSFVGIKEYKMGNIYVEGVALDKYRNHSINSVCKCSKCRIKYLCGGDCYYNSYMKTGRSDLPDSEFCFVQKHIIETAIILSMDMYTENETLYKKLTEYIIRKDDYVKIFG